MTMRKQISCLEFKGLFCFKNHIIFLENLLQEIPQQYVPSLTLDVAYNSASATGDGVESPREGCHNCMV